MGTGRRRPAGPGAQDRDLSPHRRHGRRTPTGAKVLDCGTATGFLMQVAEESGYEPYGIKLCSYGARAIGDRFGPDRVFEGEIEHARFPRLEAPLFAAIFMCDYLEHVRDPARVLRCAAALLRPSWRLVISTGLPHAPAHGSPVDALQFAAARASA